VRRELFRLTNGLLVGFWRRNGKKLDIRQEVEKRKNYNVRALMGEDPAPTSETLLMQYCDRAIGLPQIIGDT
jgi:hypothetical protein